jgi:hypothetical protein
MVAATLVAACAGAAGPPEMAAVIVEPTEQTRAELARAVEAVYHGAPVLLADDALTTDSSLVLEHAHPVDAQGRLLNGRELGRPEIFDLVIGREGCVLIHRRTGQRTVLRTAHCVAHDGR